MRRTNWRRSRATVTHGVVGFQAGDPNPNPNDPPPPDPGADAVARAKYEADAAKGEVARVKRELEELRKGLPTDEQRARWAELEQAAKSAEEEKMRREGDWNGIREQMQARHMKELEAERAMRENSAAQQRQTETELRDTLIGLEFRGASALFGPTGKTVLLPEVAQSHFAPHVEVETIAGVNGGPSRRRVLVKDAHGQTIVDPKNGQPMPFAKAMEEVIDAHPQREHLLRGSGKSGSGSPGGGGGPNDGPDINRLKASDFNDPKVREAVRASQSKAGGLQVGPAFDRMRAAKK